jgi:hypothetical protein
MDEESRNILFIKMEQLQCVRAYAVCVCVNKYEYA